MAVYEVITPTGEAYEVEGPEGATKAQLVAAVRRQIAPPVPPRDREAELAAIYRRQAELEPVTFGQQIQEIPKGIGSGIAGILESAALGAATLLPEEQELAARRGIQAVGGGVQDFLAPDINIQSRIAEGKNNFDTIPRKFSEALGSFGGILGASLIPYVGIPAAGALAVGAGAGEASERAREEGATQEERTRAAQLGALVGATELLPIQRARKFISTIPKKNQKELTERIIDIGFATTAEGAQEASAAILQNMIEQGYNPEQATFEGAVEQGSYGAGVGATVQTILNFIDSRRGRGTPPPTEETDPQRELFGPDVDLGTAPRPQPTQGELFGRETDLGTDPRPRATERTTKDPRQQEMDLGPEQLDLFADRRKEQETKAKEVDLARTAATTDTAMGEQISRQLAERQKQEQQFKEAETALDAKKVEDKFAVAPDKPVEQIQPSLPGLKPTYGEKRRQARIDEREVKTEPTATGVQLTEELVSTMAGRDPNVVTSGLLDRLGVSPKAPMRKRVEGKDINTPEVRQQFIDLGNNPKVAQQTRLNISRYLADVAEGQGDLFAPQKRGKPDAGIDTTRSGVGVSSNRQDASKTAAIQVDSAKEIDALGTAGLGELGTTIDAVDAREGPEAGALTYDELSREQKQIVDAAPENEKDAVLSFIAKTNQGIDVADIDGAEGVAYLDAVKKTGVEPTLTMTPETKEALAKQQTKVKEPEPVITPTSDAGNVNPDFKTKFNPKEDATLVNRRAKADPDPSEEGVSTNISGGLEEGNITSPTKTKKQFDSIGYQGSKPEIGNLQETVKTKYKNSFPNIKIFGNNATWDAAHMNGGVAIEYTQTKDKSRVAYLMAHELGHASHSLLGNKVNKNPNIKTELKAIENFIYPNLREQIKTAEAQNKNVDTEFFNYLLSPEELIAEFNVYRVNNETQVSTIAPNLSKLLASVEADKNLVKPRNVFPGFLTLRREVDGAFDLEGNPIIDEERIRNLEGKAKPFVIGLDKRYDDFRVAKKDNPKKALDIYNTFIKGHPKLDDNNIKKEIAELEKKLAAPEQKQAVEVLKGAGKDILAGKEPPQIRTASKQLPGEKVLIGKIRDKKEAAKKEEIAKRKEELVAAGKKFIAKREGLEGLTREDLDREFRDNFKNTATTEQLEENFKTNKDGTLGEVLPESRIVGIKDIEAFELGAKQKYFKEEILETPWNDPENFIFEDLQDPTTAKDKKIILDLVTDKTKKLSKEAQEAKKYFSNNASVHGGLEEIIANIAHAKSAFRKENLGAQKNPEILTDLNKIAQEELYKELYLESKGSKSARLARDFIEKNMSKETDTYVTKRLQEEHNERERLKKETGQDIYKYLPIVDISSLAYALHPKVRKLLSTGNLSKALKNMSLDENLPKEITILAKKLANDIGTTKVEIDSNIEKSAAGLFDPKTNTIKINPAKGLNAHVLLHEVTHAVTSATLANKSHPTTKELTKLYNDVKGSLGTYYGTQSVDEFVAEAFSNPTFQQELASIGVKGEPVSALKRFFNSIVNFIVGKFGGKKVPLNALEAANPLIESIMTPAPKHRNANALLMNSRFEGVKGAFGKLSKQMNDRGYLTSKQQTEFLGNALDFIKKGPSAIVEGFLGFTDGIVISDIAARANKELGKLAEQLNLAMLNQRGGMDKAANRFDVEAQKLVKFAKQYPEQHKLLDDIIYSEQYGATIYQVDPTKELKDYEGKFDNSGNSLTDVFIDQQKQWRKLNSEGKKAFNDMRKYYTSEYTKLKDVIFGQIDTAMGKDSEGAKKLKNNVFRKIFDANTLDVYFPLVREGRFKVTYHLYPEVAAKRGGDSKVVEMVSNSLTAKARVEELKNDSKNIMEGTIEVLDTDDSTIKNFQNAPSSTFVGEALNIIAENVSDKTEQAALRENIVRLFIDTLPETSFAKSLQKRKGIKGADNDSIAAFRTKGFDLGRQVVRLESGAKIREIENNISNLMQKDLTDKLDPEDRKKLATDKLNVSIQRVGNQLLQRAQFGRNGAKYKGIEKIAKTANQVAFTYTIGFNISSALVNMSQIPLFAYPYLGAEYGYNKTRKAFMRSSGFVMNSRNAINDFYDADFKVKDTISYSYLEGKVRKEKERPVTTKEKEILKKYAPLVKMASEQGQLTKSFLIDALGLQEAGRIKQGNVAARVLDTIAAFSAIPFNQAERFNRQSILLASFELAVDSGMNPEQAAAKALRQTQELNGGAVLETAPKWAQQNIGRVGLMYKGYGIRMVTTMLKSSMKVIDTTFSPRKGESTKEKEEREALRKVAIKQLFGVFGSSLFFSGVHGLPIYGIYVVVANLLFLDDEELDADTLARQYVGEEWFKGPINVITGGDIASRVRLSGLLFQANKYNKDATFEENAFFYAGGPAWSTIQRLGRAYEDATGTGASGQVDMQRAVEGMLPAGISNIIKASPVGRVYQEGYKTRRGDVIYGDLSYGELAFLFFGVSPAEYIQQMDENGVKKRIDTKVNKKKSQIRSKIYKAMRDGDLTAYYEAMDEAYAHNAKHPLSPITSESIKKSIRGSERTSKNIKENNGVQISSTNRNLIREMVNDYDTTYQLSDFINFG